MQGDRRGGRRWQAGDRAELDGLQFRVQPGSKKADDLRLDVMVNGKWQPVHMRLAALIVDFLYENEDALYPREPHSSCLVYGCNGSRGHGGGEYYIRYLRKAGRDGWRVAQAELEGEKAVKTLFDDPSVFLPGEDDRDG